MLCRPAHFSSKSWGRKNSFVAKKDGLEYVKSHWKESEIYSFSCSVTRNFLCRSTMVANIFEDFEPPSKKFLATPLLCSNIHNCETTSSATFKLFKPSFRTNLHGKNSITINAIDAWNKAQTYFGETILKNLTPNKIKTILRKRMIDNY